MPLPTEIRTVFDHAFDIVHNDNYRMEFERLRDYKLEMSRKGLLNSSAYQQGINNIFKDLLDDFSNELWNKMKRVIPLEAIHSYDLEKELKDYLFNRIRQRYNETNNTLLAHKLSTTNGWYDAHYRSIIRKCGFEIIATVVELNQRKGFNALQAYAYVKYAGTMWMLSMARKYPKLKFIVVSPGNTKGTQAPDNLPPPMRFMLKFVMMPIVFPLIGGMVHKLEVGAKRFVDGISDERYKSGVFYASKEGKLSGDMVDQSTFFTDLKNTSFQDNANEAIHHFIN